LPLEVDQHGLAPTGCGARPDRRSVDGQDHRGSGVVLLDATGGSEVGGAVVVEQVGQRERQVAEVPGQLRRSDAEDQLLGRQHARVGPEVAQCRQPPLADHPLGVFADHAQHADHVARVVSQRTVGEGVVALLGVAGPLHEQQQCGVPGGHSRREYPLDPRTDVVPDLRPYFACGAPERPWVLAGQRVTPVGVIAEEGEFRPPGHPHREPRRQQDADGRQQALRPLRRRSERRGRPVDLREVRTDGGIGIEHRRVCCGRDRSARLLTTHRTSSRRRA
jgi:hypothetical protein